MKKSLFPVLSMIGLNALASNRSIAFLITLVIIYLIVHGFKYLIEREKTKQNHDDNERMIKQTQIISESISERPNYNIVHKNQRSTNGTKQNTMSLETKKILIKLLNRNMHYQHNNANADTSESNEKVEDVASSTINLIKSFQKGVNKSE